MDPTLNSVNQKLSVVEAWIAAHPAATLALWIASVLVAFLVGLWVG